jgi:hypothetical protein
LKRFRFLKNKYHSMAHPLAALQDYPPEGPPIPESKKEPREKDRHDPGTGRRDRQKRQGRGKFNWGDPVADALAAEAEPLDDYECEEEAAPGPPSEPAPASKPANAIFADSDDDEVESRKGKSVAKVPPDFVSIVKVPADVEVVPDETPYYLKKKADKPKKPAKQPYVPETEEDDEAPDDEGEGGAGKQAKKPSRDKRFTGVQHNRDHPSPAPQPRTDH